MKRFTLYSLQYFSNGELARNEGYFKKCPRNTTDAFNEKCRIFNGLCIATHTKLFISMMKKEEILAFQF